MEINVDEKQKVIIKFTGGARNLSDIKAAVKRITKDGELETYNYDGFGNEYTWKGQDFNREVTESLTSYNDYDKKYKGKHIRHVINMVFSPPPNANVSREDALKAVTELLIEKYPENAFAAVYHDDIHRYVMIIFKLRNEETDKRVHFSKADFHSLRSAFAKKLITQGYLNVE